MFYVIIIVLNQDFEILSLKMLSRLCSINKHFRGTGKEQSLFAFKLCEYDKVSVEFIFLLTNVLLYNVETVVVHY